MMARKPDDRFATAADVAAALQSHARQAPPPSISQKSSLSDARKLASGSTAAAAALEPASRLRARVCSKRPFGLPANDYHCQETPMLPFCVHQPECVGWIVGNMPAIGSPW